MCPKPRVLLLDDDVMALELYSRELATDYDVLVCESVMEYRQRQSHQTVDVLIIEPAIGEGEGWELMAEIQAAANRPVTIVCSVEDERRAALSRGTDAYLVKPVLPTQLHALLDQIMRRHLMLGSRRPGRR